MRKGYSLGKRRRNPYVKRLGRKGRAELEQRYFESEGLIRLEADVADEFHNALRLVMRLRKVGGKSTRKTRHAS